MAGTTVVEVDGFTRLHNGSIRYIRLLAFTVTLAVLQIGGDSAQICLGHVLRRKFNDFGHRGEGCSVDVSTGPEEFDDVVLRPILQSAIAATADDRCRPALQLAALQVLILLVRSGEVLRRVAAPLNTQPIQCRATAV